MKNPKSRRSDKKSPKSTVTCVSANGTVRTHSIGSPMMKFENDEWFFTDADYHLINRPSKQIRVFYE